MSILISKIKKILRSKSGETIMEAIASMLILTILLTTIASMIRFSLNLTSITSEKADMEQEEVMNYLLLDDFGGVSNPTAVITTAVITLKADGISAVNHTVDFYTDENGTIAFIPK